MKTKYAEIIFLQGESYEDEVGEMIRDGELSSAVVHLSSWDYGHETDDASEYRNPNGEIDAPRGFDVFESGEYTLVYNDSLSCCALYRPFLD